MANPISSSLPLYEKIKIKRKIDKIFDIIITFLLLSLLGYRLHLLYNHGFSWLQAIPFHCEFWFSFTWVLVVLIKWNPVEYKPHPHRLLKQVKELPPVDVFVTTADPKLEPPIVTVNTVLSLLAVDYPANKLACYVSDDGCSPLTYYSLCQAVKFAKFWVPFCKKYRVQVRAPFRYFSAHHLNHDDLVGSPEFKHDWTRMKDKYEELVKAIEEADQNILQLNLRGELAEFSNIESKNHPTIIKIIWENKGGLLDALPHLIYIAREKRPKHSHHYKAGAMNVLTRVSGMMTNGPYMLNVDCDMFVNDPNVILDGMCFFLDPIMDKECAFVQFPQCFYNGLKDDPFGNQFIAATEFVIRGITGIQGPPYMGTGCIHKRRIIYGQFPDNSNICGINSENELHNSFGNSKNFIKSVIGTLTKSSCTSHISNSLSHSIESSKRVAASDYEYSSHWGSKVGWQYGSTSEDILTGLTIHKKGWKSILITPNPPAFLGCVPSEGPIALIQLNRWMTGNLSVFFSKNCPIFNAKLKFMQCISYLWLLLWGVRSVPEILYALLPPYCLITNSHFLPKVDEPMVWIPLMLFLIFNLHQLLQYLETGQSVRAWLNNQKMVRVNTICGGFCGLVSIVMKALGLSELAFEVTKKELASSGSDEDSSQFSFDESPLFLVGTTILMVQLTTLFMSFFKMQASGGVGKGFGLGEVMCNLWLIMCFWPFFKGMFTKGKSGLPWFTLSTSTALTLLFVYYVKG